MQGHVEIRQAAALGGENPGWETPGIEHSSTRIIQRQGQAKPIAGLHFLDRPDHPIGGQEVEPALLIVRSEVAPIGAFRPIYPASNHPVSPKVFDEGSFAMFVIG
jgi:hypothetical protein